MPQDYQGSIEFYQIQNTPFFRRLQRENPDKLERLKQAYQSVRNFNAKPIETEVKKIRLGKLFKRIKDSIRGSKHRKKDGFQPKTDHQLRCEQLEKARQMGIDYARQNFHDPVIRLCFENKCSSQDTRMDEKSRLRLRIDYGNKKSLMNRYNLQSSSTTQKSTTFKESSHNGQKKIHFTRNDLKKLLIHCLSADQPSSEVIRFLENITLQKSNSYWDLMSAINRQEEKIKNFAEIIKRLSDIDSEQSDIKSEVTETYMSKTNITSGCSEILIRTYRYQYDSDDGEFLPPPSESLLKLSEDTPEHVEMSMPTQPECIQDAQKPKYQNPTLKPFRMGAEKMINLPQQENIIEQVRISKESSTVLKKLDNIMKH